MAMLAAIPFRLNPQLLNSASGGDTLIPSFSYFLATFVLLNIGLMLFNLIPLAPLDGFKVALGVLPDEWANNLARLEQYGPIILMLLLVSGSFGFNIFGQLMGPAQIGLFRLFIGR
jgi:Zn-dependent protease